ncbi:transcription termination factor Rho [Methanococcus maripaludis]|uniref:Transcription termination factor Rho n=1 Tax=Methanococcus maripaludis TaxID=39152 RepID=A0A7J9S7B1_METMI|nr:hypothetical protein [Methanococcus maripaludis]MBB6402682.1 transcription termination factor Rho [Methanococcus maripaludis]
MPNIKQEEQKERNQQKIAEYQREVGPQKQKKQENQDVQKEIRKKQAHQKKHQHKDKVC